MSSAVAILQGLKQRVKSNENYECRTLQVHLPVTTAVDIEFSDITYTVPDGFKSKKKKIILNGISGQFRSGQVTAIMGPSGAGKSSLMNALTGFSTQGVTGTIRAGNSICELGKKQKSTSFLKDYRKKSCYIMQDDRLNPLFTVAEIMKFAADMKLGNTLSDTLKITVINDVLETFGLCDKKDTRCASLSGGQRKRVSIALELIDNPPVVYLDEPTTGLDSSTSAQCIQLLKNLAQNGLTVVCSIHQPSASVYSMFDQVYILANGIRVYQGSSENTVPFLASVGLLCPKYHNPADFILEITNGEYGDFNEILANNCTQKEWRKKPSLSSDDSVRNPFTCSKATVAINPPHELYKFGVLFRRCFVQQYRDWTVSHLKVCLHLFIGGLLGMLFYNAGADGSKTFNNLGFLIFSCVYVTYTTIMPAVLKFPLELSVLKKEYFNNWYNLKSYYAAMLFTTIPLQIWYSFVFSAPSYFLTGQPQEMCRYSMYVLMLTALMLLADAVGCVIGALVNPINGTFLGAILTCAMIVFSGFLVLMSHMSATMRVISYASFIKYAFEGVALVVYSYNRPPLACHKEYCHLRYPKELLKEFSFKPENYWINFSVLIVTMVFLRILGYFTLKRYVNRSK